MVAIDHVVLMRQAKHNPGGRVVVPVSTIVIIGVVIVIIIGVVLAVLLLLLHW